MAHDALGLLLRYRVLRALEAGSWPSEDAALVEAVFLLELREEIEGRRAAAVGAAIT